MSKAPLFIANDERVLNSYNFAVETAGINLDERFKPNPVCLNNHSNDTKDVLGLWVDIEIKEGKLLMRPAFDTEDQNGKEVVRKVLSGTIKGCSLGIMFDPADLVNENGRLVLKKCILFEVSIVAVPSNGNAIALFNMNQEPMSEQEIKSLCLSLQTAEPFNTKNKMKLLTTHLQLAEGSSEEAILLAVKAVEAKLTDSKREYSELKTKYDALETAQTAQLETDYEKLKSLALADGRIDAESVPTIEELPLQKRIDLLNKLPKRKSINSQVEDDDKNSPEAKYGKLSWSELDKGNHLAQLKAEYPEYYTERYTEHYGKAPSK